MLYETAAAILEHYRSRLVAAGSPAFDRVLVSDGEVAFDGCESLIVQHEQARPGTPVDVLAPARIHGGMPLVHGFRVWALRCVPVADEQGEAPGVSAITASALALLAERDRLIAATYELPEALGMCASVALLDVTGVGPEGGIGGASVGLVVQP